jgi:hypothetical protein
MTTPDTPDTPTPTTPAARRQDWPSWAIITGFCWLILSQILLLGAAMSTSLFIWFLRLLGSSGMDPDPAKRSERAQQFTSDFDQMAGSLVFIAIAACVLSWVAWVAKFRIAALVLPVVGAIIAATFLYVRTRS